MTPEREGRPSARPTSNVAMSEATIYRVRWADLTRYQAFLFDVDEADATVTCGASLQVSRSLRVGRPCRSIAISPDLNSQASGISSEPG